MGARKRVRKLQQLEPRSVCPNNFRIDLEETGSKQKRKTLIKTGSNDRVDRVTAKNRPEWMVARRDVPRDRQTCAPLRVAGQRHFATSDLKRPLYRRISNRTTGCVKTV